MATSLLSLSYPKGLIDISLKRFLVVLVRLADKVLVSLLFGRNISVAHRSLAEVELVHLLFENPCILPHLAARGSRLLVYGQIRRD